MTEFYDDEDINDDEFSWPQEDFDHKRIALYIMDSSGNIEDILIDIDDILNYVKKIYATYPAGD